jgi:hypothetical protein
MSVSPPWRKSRCAGVPWHRAPWAISLTVRGFSESLGNGARGTPAAGLESEDG